jgi:predicted MPP superfamily phosphohydrolase
VHRILLDTPRVLPVDGPGELSEPPRDRLAAPSPARERRRPLFHPRRGWLRRLERQISHILARDLFPYLPGIHLPYDRQLRYGLTLSEARVAVDDLPAAFDGLRILFVSDVHAGPFVSVEVLAQTFERLLGSEPDVVLIGGDLINARLCEFESHRAAFERLRAPLGVHAVLGNHDHYSREPARLRKMIRAAGIEVLHNEAIELRRAGESLSIAGVDDMLLGDPDLDRALAGTRGPVVLLSHNPDLLFEAARRGVRLMLSGHTHGGQVRLPRLGVLVRQSRYRLDEGRFRAGETELIVSRGLGAVALPQRVHCPPEGVLVRLTRS